MLLLEKLFKLSKFNTSVKKEVTAGIITFLTMSYIIIVNPIILKDSGINIVAVFIATCLVSALAAFLMAFYANLPLAVAPGMGLNAMFTYTIVIAMGYSWQNALAITFIAGILIILVAIFLSKDFLIKAVPQSLKYAVTAGIGMFIIMIALKNAGILVSNPNTITAIAKFDNIIFFAIIAGFFVIAFSFIKKWYFAPVLVIAVLTLFNNYLHPIEFKGIINYNLNLNDTFFAMNFDGIANLALMSVIVTVFFASFFDSFGTLISYFYFLNPKDPQLDGKATRKALIVEGIACSSAGVLGTSPTAIFLESNTGISYGGRTGLTSFTIGVLFLISTFFSLLINYIPIWVASPILLFLGVLMMSSIRNINFEDITDAIPSIACIIVIPLSYSISIGIASAFICYVITKLVSGKFQEISILTWVLSSIFMLSFIV